MFGENNKFRKWLFKLANGSNVNFERSIVIMILISAVQLGLQNPRIDPHGFFARGLYWVDFFTTGLFILEALAKIIAYGFLFNGPLSYLRNIWNVLDFIILLISMAAISPLANQLQIFKMFRVLRLINRAEGLRIGLQSLLRAIPNVLRIVMILILFFLIFGIIAIS